MSAAGPIRWHYTVVTKLRPAVRDGALRPVAVGAAPQEKPAVWFSTNPVWEETANLAYVGEDGLARPGTKESTHWLGGGLARVGVRPEDAPHDWKAYKARSGLSGELARRLYEAGITAGSRPAEWFVSFEPVPAAKWVAVQIWDGRQWVAYQPPGAAAGR